MILVNVVEKLNRTIIIVTTIKTKSMVAVHLMIDIRLGQHISIAKNTLKLNKFNSTDEIKTQDSFSYFYDVVFLLIDFLFLHKNALNSFHNDNIRNAFSLRNWLDIDIVLRVLLVMVN